MLRGWGGAGWKIFLGIEMGDGRGEGVKDGPGVELEGWPKVLRRTE